MTRFVPSDHKPKSKSQTLRAVLFRRYEREVGTRAGVFLPFEDFYAGEMEKIINNEKNKL